MDFLWRANVARLVTIMRPERVLDLATGSGDLALAIQKCCPSAMVVGADFCFPMLEQARLKSTPILVQADALNLPFADASFDVVTVAFGLRNMASWDGALREMSRVLRDGGLVVVLDFSMPTNPLFSKLYRLYLHRILPHLAGFVTGQSDAYAYLGESIEAFPRGEAMVSLINSCGFSCEAPLPFCGGIVSLYAARRED